MGADRRPAALAPGAPPVPHTLHWDLRKDAGFYSGLPELVEHGRTGWLAMSPEDLVALAQMAGRIDPRECREQAARRFTPAVMAARYADLYEQLISGFVPRAAEQAVPDRPG